MHEAVDIYGECVPRIIKSERITVRVKCNQHTADLFGENISLRLECGDSVAGVAAGIWRSMLS
jgi:hypothetical protein